MFSRLAAIVLQDLADGKFGADERWLREPGARQSSAVARVRSVDPRFRGGDAVALRLSFLRKPVLGPDWGRGASPLVLPGPALTGPCVRNVLDLTSETFWGIMRMFPKRFGAGFSRRNG